MNGIADQIGGGTGEDQLRGGIGDDVVAGGDREALLDRLRTARAARANLPVRFSLWEKDRPAEES